MLDGLTSITRDPANMRTNLLPAMMLVAALLSSRMVSAEWTQFRGPQGNGVCEDVKLPTRWSVGQNVAWSASLPGVAWSQPVVWRDKIFVTSAITDDQQLPHAGESGPGFTLFSREGFSRAFLNGGEPPKATYRWKVFCLDGATGRILWEQTAREGRPSIPIHRSNTYASETPVTDGHRLIAYFGMAGLFCYDLDGRLLWKKELGSYPTQYGWGTGSSPVLHGTQLFVQVDNEESSFLVAFDKETGDEAWRVERDERSNWSTPFIWTNGLRTELITAGGNKVRSYKPQTGQLLWELNAHGRSATTPVADEERLYVGSVTRSTGSSEELVAIRAGARGDISSQNGDDNSAIAWRVRAASPELASPLLYRGCLYTLKQQGGIVVCFDAETGRQHYRLRLPGAKNFTASPWANQERVFCMDEAGQTFVLAAGPKSKLLATNKLDGMFWSSAAVVEDRLLLRGVEKLYCILH